jgi:hypothetical protein
MAGRGVSATAGALLLGGQGLELVASFGSWARTGLEHRNSYELVSVARRLGVIDNHFLAALARAWVLLPLLTALVLVAAVLGRWPLAASGSTVCALATVGLAFAVNSSPVLAETMVGVAAAGAAAALVGAVLTVVTGQEGALR